MIHKLNVHYQSSRKPLCLCSYMYHSFNASMFLLQAFAADVQCFRSSVADFDQRLASILCRAFDDCSGCEAVFKVSMVICHCIITLDYNVYYATCI